MDASRQRRMRPAAALAAASVLLGCGAGCGGGSAGAGNAWRDTAIDVAASITLGAEHGVVFYAFDVLAHPDEEVELTASVLSLRRLDQVGGVTVGYFLADEKLGQAATDGEGRATLKWKPPGRGDYEITVKILAVPDDDLEDMLEASPTPLWVSVRPKDARFVVIDLDHTVVASGFARVLIGGARPMSRAAEVVSEIAKEYSLIYLTHRPDLLAGKSKRWLADNGFPKAPLLVSTLRQAAGGSGEYKTARLKQLRECFGRLEIGIGDKVSDVHAYTANGMRAFLIPHYDRDDEEDLRELAERLGEISGDVDVVDGWDQIRAGIFTDARYSPGAYADGLRARARRLREERAARQQKEDEDD